VPLAGRAVAMSDLPRIIFIYHRSYPAWFPAFGDDSWYLAGHTGLIANYLRQSFPHLEIENWRPDVTQGTYSERVVSGVTCRVFPSRFLPSFGEFSPSLIIHLSTILSNYRNVIIHYGGISSGIFHYLLFRYGSGVRIIGNHQGDRLRSMRTDLKSMPRKHLERLLFRRAHHYLCAGQTTMECLSSLGVRRESITFPEIGIDFEMFRPIDQLKARQALHLPQHRPLILYVGRADRHKGLPELLDVMPDITSRSGAELVCVGCFEKDPLYPRLREMRIRHWPHVSHDQLPLFHSASDVFVRATMSPVSPVSVGVNVAEALACGTPVVSPTLLELPYYDTYREGIGLAPGDDLTGAIVQVIKDGKAGRATLCREAVGPYSWETWLRNLTSVYYG
jgi:glycosyltransferase involved in cell wall biosynthesis